MSFDEQEQSNQALAAEGNFWPMLKPERSLQDNHEIPTGRSLW